MYSIDTFITSTRLLSVYGSMNEFAYRNIKTYFMIVHSHTDTSIFMFAVKVADVRQQIKKIKHTHTHIHTRQTHSHATTKRKPEAIVENT